MARRLAAATVALNVRIPHSLRVRLDEHMRRAPFRDRVTIAELVSRALSKVLDDAESKRGKS